MTTDEKPTFKDHAEEIAWHQAQADGEGAESPDDLEPVSCTDCGQDFNTHSPITHQAKGLTLCLTCAYDGERDAMAESDREYVAEHRWAGRTDQ